MSSESSLLKAAVTDKALEASIGSTGDPLVGITIM